MLAALLTAVLGASAHAQSGVGTAAAPSGAKIDPATRRLIPLETVPIDPTARTTTTTTALFPNGMPAFMARINGQKTVASDGTNVRRASVENLSVATAHIGPDGKVHMNCSEQHDRPQAGTTNRSTLEAAHAQ